MPFEIIPSGTNINFLGHRRVFLALSLILIGLSIVEVLTRDSIPLGIDFVGGTEIQVLFDEGVVADESAIRDVAREAGIVDATVVRFGDEGVNEYLIRFKADVANAKAAESGEPVDGLEANTRIIQLEKAIREIGRAHV